MIPLPQHEAVASLTTRPLAVLAAMALLTFGSPAPAQAQTGAEDAMVRSQAGSAMSGARPRRVGIGQSVLPVAAARGSAPLADNGPACAGGLPEPLEVRISAGKATLVNMAEPITRRTLGDPGVVEGRMVSPTVLYLVAGRIGSTNAILQGKSGRCVLLDIVVGIDTSAVQTKLSELMPTEKSILVTAAADSLVLSGTVSDAVSADRAVAVANAYVMAAYQQGFTASGGGRQANAAIADAGGSKQLARIVNMLSVTASHQVMLEVKVAEISKTLIDKLGSSFAGSRTNGSFTYQLLTDFLSTGATGGLATLMKSNGNAVQIDAEQRDGLVRILAEPNVMAISGQEGSFLAGGKILIPVNQANNNGVTTITLEEKEFGVGLKFTPTVLGDGRINLKVAPEVSELSRDGVGISNTIGGNAILPLITTRRASTTVQLFDGQSFAIGGLMKNSTAANVRALPVLGQLPIIGALFRSTDFQSEKTELVFIVTPRLVKPLPVAYSLPTDKVGEPQRNDIYLRGRLDSEGTPDKSNVPATNVGGMELK